MSVCAARDVHPANVAAKVGETVTLQCSKSSASYIQWLEHVTHHTDQVISTNGFVKHVTRAGRYNISRQVAGHYDLVIPHVALDDAGRYTCSVVDSRELRSAYVIVLGSEPTCTSTPNVRPVTEGDPMTHSCSISYSGLWAPVMAWTGPNGRTLPTNNDTTAPTGSQSVRRVKYSVRVPALVSADGRAVAYFCRIYFDMPSPKASIASVVDNVQRTYAKDPPGYQFSHVTRRLVINYSVRNLHVVSPKTVYHGGDVVVLTANGHPSPSFRWADVATNRTVLTGSTLVLGANVAGALSYQCTAANVVRGRTHRQNLHVDVFVAEPDDLMTSDVIWTTADEVHIEAITNVQVSYMIGAVFACVVSVFLAPVILCVVCTGRSDTTQSVKRNANLGRFQQTKTAYRQHVTLGRRPAYRHCRDHVPLAVNTRTYRSTGLQSYQSAAQLQAAKCEDEVKLELLAMKRRPTVRTGDAPATVAKPSTNQGHGDQASRVWRHRRHMAPTNCIQLTSS
ncbi:hypothetical protein LSAT2_029746 [Lamellibrachia satsuma]|nr:hypothetical protein LSAT2_029746 [Lamellibrachia satsuma]